MDEKTIMRKCTTEEEEEEEDLRAELQVVRRFSPKGTFPKDFNKWMELRKTPGHGGSRSQGVFTKRAFPEGMMLGEYRGPRDYTGSDNRKRKETTKAYLLEVSSPGLPGFVILGHLFDRHSPRSGSWCRFVNAPNAEEQPNAVFAAYWFRNKIRVVLETQSPIQKGQQILVAYALKD